MAALEAPTLRSADRRAECMFRRLILRQVTISDRSAAAGRDARRSAH